MLFDDSTCSTFAKLENFPKYVRRQKIARFLVQYELFRKQMPVKGSIIECGVHHGGGVMAWAHLSATLEPYNYHRRVIGFDTFSGFPSVSGFDNERRTDVGIADAQQGDFSEDYDVLEEMAAVVREFDSNRFLNQKQKVELVAGDACESIPRYVAENQHLMVSMLFLDFDLYEPTIVALQNFLPRMPKGAIVAFDELNNPHWPGETRAFLEQCDVSAAELKCFEFEPNISYFEI